MNKYAHDLPGVVKETTVFAIVLPTPIVNVPQCPTTDRNTKNTVQSRHG